MRGNISPAPPDFSRPKGRGIKPQGIKKCSVIHKHKKWLYSPIIKSFIRIHDNKNTVKMTSFSLYENDILVAGEFGVIIGDNYISYSGYHEKPSAGTIQMYLTYKYLQVIGIKSICLYGHSDDEFKNRYKYELGCNDINIKDYLRTIET
jgi:Leu/Phe-tRNA-protein transferase